MAAIMVNSGKVSNSHFRDCNLRHSSARLLATYYLFSFLPLACLVWVKAYYGWLTVISLLVALNGPTVH